jgi:hypothetical protein
MKLNIYIKLCRYELIVEAPFLFRKLWNKNFECLLWTLKKSVLLVWECRVYCSYNVCIPPHPQNQAFLMKSTTVFWDIMLCSPLKVNRHFGRTYCLHLQGRINLAKYQCESRWCTEQSAG